MLNNGLFELLLDSVQFLVSCLLMGCQYCCINFRWDRTLSLGLCGYLKHLGDGIWSLLIRRLAHLCIDYFGLLLLYSPSFFVSKWLLDVYTYNFLLIVNFSSFVNFLRKINIVDISLPIGNQTVGIEIAAID